MERNYNTNISDEYILNLCDTLEKYNTIKQNDFEHYGVKRGLRNPDGSGVMAGISLICNVRGYILSDGDKEPIPGELKYRGINIRDIIKACQNENRFGFEEVAFLILFGKLPTKKELDDFYKCIAENRELPPFFVEDMIIKAPSKNIMNKLSRNVLALYSYDDDPDNLDLKNLLKQSISLIARFPAICVNAYQVKKRYFDKESLYVHFPQENLSTAENILYTLRYDNKFTDEEAKLLDLCLILHMDHGGGNNSTFTTRVLSSSGTDTYSAIAAAVGSLKGPKHGGANISVENMVQDIKTNLKDWNDKNSLRDYLMKIVRKEAGDGSGLIYGMGHAVYSISDPRAELLKEQARKLAAKKNMLQDFELLENIEELAPGVLSEVKGSEQIVCANVDLYSGLVYKMLGIPPELYTPLFAIARIVGWCAHRIEEVTINNKIIRPAYKCIIKNQKYIDINNRN